MTGDVPNPHPRWVLTALSLSVLLASLGTSIANVALPTLAQAFAAPFQQVQWAVLAYLLAITTLIVSAGRLGDIFGRRRLLLAGVGLFTLASLLCALALNLGWLVAARAVQGLGAALMMALTLAFVAETVPKARTGRAMGLLGTMSAVGTALGPSLGGVLIAYTGWQAIFLINLPAGLLTFLLLHRQLPADRLAGPVRPRFDALGTLLLALTLAAYALAMTMGRGSFGPLNLALLASAAVGLGLFVWSQSRAAAPLIRLGMFRDPTLRSGLATSALVATVMMATLVVGPFYLARALGLDAAMVGLVLSVGPVLSAVSGVLAGRITDRLTAPVAVIFGLATMVAGAAALTLLPALFGIAGYVAAILVLTPGYQLFQAANNTFVMADVHPDQRGTVSGLLNLARNLGLITGASVMGAVFALAAGQGGITGATPEAIATAMQITFGLGTGLIAAALAIALAGRSGSSLTGEATEPGSGCR